MQLADVQRIEERSVDASCFGFGLEDVKVTVLSDLDAFLPTAAPRRGWHVPSKTNPSRGDQGGPPPSDDDDDDQECCLTEAACMPEVVGQVRESPAALLRTREKTAFEMDGTMLRGVRMNVVLRQRAKLLSNAPGSEATFQLSKPTDHLGAFVSHNWCVSRWRKWLALSLHCNFCSALVSGTFTVSIFCVVTSMGYMPVDSVDSWYGKYDVIYSRVSGFLVFHAVLLCGPDLLLGSLVRGEEVFLDKACIHQVDLAVQRQGIESLGGFLFYSRRMVVLYTRTFTKKLWTVYEMACFLCLHPGGRLEWLPVDLLPAAFVASLVVWLNSMILWLSLVESAREVQFHSGSLLCRSFRA